MEEERKSCCDNCGYKTTKSTVFGKEKSWCCFKERSLKDNNLCPQYVDEVDVGLGKIIYFSILSSQRPLTESEQYIDSLIKTAMAIPSSDNSDNNNNNCDDNNNTKDFRIKTTQEGLDAMFQLGECYRLGNRTEKDERIAFFWHKIAANQNHANSLLLTGLQYANGIGVDKNLGRALDFFERGAIWGQPHAGYWAGRLNEENGYKGSAKSKYKVAAKHGYAWGQVYLGVIYLNEWTSGTESALKKGLFWLICAYLHGNDSPKASNEAKEQINYLIEHGSCSSDYIQREIRQIKSWHSEYLMNPKPVYSDYPHSKD